MATRIGRVTLSVPNRVPFSRAQGRTSSIIGPIAQRGYALSGREQGASVQATMDLFEREMERSGDLYCKSDEGLFPTGYYRAESPGYLKPSGRPKVRPWDLQIVSERFPTITRQAEDDKKGSVGTVATDPTQGWEEDRAVLLDVPAMTTVTVLEPRTVSGAEPFDAPSGKYRASARILNLPSSQGLGFQFAFETGAGADILVGPTVTIASLLPAYQELVLLDGTSNINPALPYWYRLKVTNGTGGTKSVYIDRVRIARIP